MMAAKDELGRAGEDLAAAWLSDAGWVLLERNWRCRAGELDLVALDGDTLVAVEVKTRAGLGFGHPFEAITEVKLRRLHVLVRAFAAAHAELARGRALRVDAVAIVRGDRGAAPRIEHLRGLS